MSVTRRVRLIPNYLIACITSYQAKPLGFACNTLHLLPHRSTKTRMQYSHFKLIGHLVEPQAVIAKITKTY